MRLDFLVTPQTAVNGRELVRAAHAGAVKAGHDAVMVARPRAGSVLVLYGLGGVERLGAWNRHKANGGRLIAFDAGYWDRKLASRERRYRVSVDGFHCPHLILRGPSPSADRWNSSGFVVRKLGNPGGPIMLVGNGPKSRAVGAASWCADKSREIRAALPGCKILYRPKPKRSHDQGVQFDAVSTGPIDSELVRVSLVVCRHSNVSVDACRLGVPVVCDDGAAACIYPQALRHATKQPSVAQRRDFLRRLAWWQWSPNECESGAFWQWMVGVLDAA